MLIIKDSDLEYFENWLLESNGLSGRTAKSYMQRVRSILKKAKSADDCDVEKHLSLFSPSHRRFSSSAWAKFKKCLSERPLPSDLRKTNMIALLNIVANLNVELLLSMKLDDKLSDDHPLCFNSEVVFMNDEGILHLTYDQHKILSIYSKHGRLVHLE